MPIPKSPRPRATSYDVAIAAGVAQSTVSRCFQAGSNISEETRKHVLTVAQRLGYTPNSLARSLITRRSNVIGVLVTRYTLHGTPSLLYTLGDELALAGQHMILLPVDDDSGVQEALRGLGGYPLDGLIACASMQPADIENLAARGVPVLFFNRQSGSPHADSVSTDHGAAARQLARDMAAAGGRDFLCLSGPASSPVGRERIKGFQAGLRAAGRPAPRVLDGGFSYDQARAVFLDAMREGAPPDAVFCANDQMAMGVIDACRHQLGWPVPGRLMVAGFDDVPEGARPPYRITTIRQPIETMARRAVELLLARRQQPGRAALIERYPGERVVRESAL
ncbi:LacI family DNA-binding transcriptional regulator [Bordetella hinzii]|uniref:LacI family DNA-binding transcriptional regulator n=1 Tax=Bordetella hinzii TaxID=103855 RepID=UPI0004597C30|nr:LacI family DNA-binding transcriptional regulator [Bordetella hinzii]KCB49303.1 periplasmic-binding protein-like domain protein [Bordetella hinzii 4161]KXA74266.1 LacI family transcriptional regulator [Bordetella hinzii LMG 13501]MCJ9707794.1 LacI family DNA-binding transcriptional regulator [Bordetella hinzii]QDJ36045.1 LacI family transcriptional regulator [Bordetella hinzii]QDJ49593.1 LacI family transcriptional regulator [Bordetella hinzii]